MIKLQELTSWKIMSAKNLVLTAITQPKDDVD